MLAAVAGFGVCGAFRTKSRDKRFTVARPQRCEYVMAFSRLPQELHCNHHKCRDLQRRLRRCHRREWIFIELRSSYAMYPADVMNYLETCTDNEKPIHCTGMIDTPGSTTYYTILEVSPRAEISTSPVWGTLSSPPCDMTDIRQGPDRDVVQQGPLDPINFFYITTKTDPSSLWIPVGSFVEMKAHYLSMKVLFQVRQSLRDRTKMPRKDNGPRTSQKPNSSEPT